MFEALIARGLLPPSNTRRWVGKRKNQVVVAIEAGTIALGDACRFYNLTIEEFLDWREDTHGNAIRKHQFEHDGEDNGQQEQAPSLPHPQEQRESRHKGRDVPLCGWGLHNPFCQRF